MPYELLMKWGISGALILILAFLIKANTDREVKATQEHKEFVNQIIQQSKEEKTLLVQQIDKYNTSLQANTEQLREISENIKSIPKMQEDINYLKTIIK
ncbi:hypothetical protein NE169_18220 [Clostridium botulinum]|uniref:hypothetical protein n=1 Tax=Clostridium botulinum TaxID=1491 RepID=UPI002148D38B|nr:hypothetical protein [Clostridium botulinum]MCR1167252.1 hypothetical protein [Clostridium botulinum]